MQEGPFPTFPAYPRHSSRKARAFLFVAIFIIFLSLLIVGGNYFLTQQEGGDKKGVSTTSSTPTPTQQSSSPTPTATPSPKEELDKSELTVQALNGSGTSGAASDLSAVLKKAGYSVSSTGNADAFDYEETVIKLKKSKASYKDELVGDLSKSYTVSSTVETLAESAKTDAIVIVGAK